MADLGSVGRGENAPVSYVQIMRVSALTNISANKIGGTVTDASGSGVVRTLRAYVRASGLLVGETTSAANGTYNLPGVAGVEHQVLMLDDDAGNVENDQVARTITGA